jgi:hypothetical protein
MSRLRKTRRTKSRRSQRPDVGESCSFEGRILRPWQNFLRSLRPPRVEGRVWSPRKLPLLLPPTLSPLASPSFSRKWQHEQLLRLRSEHSLAPNNRHEQVRPFFNLLLLATRADLPSLSHRSGTL